MKEQSPGETRTTLCGLLRHHCDGGDMFDFIQKDERFLDMSPKDKMSGCGDLVYGLNRILKAGLVPIDIKLENILVSSENGRICFRHGDIGGMALATDLGPDKEPYVGTPEYFPRTDFAALVEAKDEETYRAICTAQCVWALSSSFFSILTNGADPYPLDKKYEREADFPPIPKGSPFEKIIKGFAGRIYPDVTQPFDEAGLRNAGHEEMIPLLKQMCDPDWKKRPTIQDLMTAFKV